MIHRLKTHPLPFLAIKDGRKKFEIRKNDRHYKVGDELLLEEFIPAGYWGDGLIDIENDEYSGNILHRKITYILAGGQYGIKKGFVILGLECI